MLLLLLLLPGLIAHSNVSLRLTNSVGLPQEQHRVLAKLGQRNKAGYKIAK